MSSHYNAIRCIENRIELINKEIEACKKKLNNSSVCIDHEFYKNDLKNFKSEKENLRMSLQFLVS